MHNRKNHNKFLDEYFNDWVCFNSFEEYNKNFDIVGGKEFDNLMYDIDTSYIAGGEL